MCYTRYSDPDFGTRRSGPLLLSTAGLISLTRRHLDHPLPPPLPPTLPGLELGSPPPGRTTLPGRESERPLDRFVKHVPAARACARRRPPTRASSGDKERVDATAPTRPVIRKHEPMVRARNEGLHVSSAQTPASDARGGTGARGTVPSDPDGRTAKAWQERMCGLLRPRERHRLVRGLIGLRTGNKQHTGV